MALRFFPLFFRRLRLGSGDTSLSGFLPLVGSLSEFLVPIGLSIARGMRGSLRGN